MNREELKKFLIERGVDERLVQMPAIIEPMLVTVRFTNPLRLKEADLVQVKPDGTYKLGERIIKLEEDGTAQITPTGNDYNEYYVITVNQAGVEDSYSDGSDLFIATRVTRKDGIVDDVFMNNGNGTYSSSKHFDNGHWSIKKAAGYRFRDEDNTPCDFSEEEVRSVFEETSRDIKLNYPGTVAWYQKIAEELESRMAEENDPIKRKELKIRALKLKKGRLEHSISDYTDGIERKLKTVGVSLDCIEKIKKNPLGKKFFVDGLEEYNEKAKRYASPSEKEERTEEELKQEKARQEKEKKEKSKEEAKKVLGPIELLEAEEKELADTVRTLGLQNEFLKLRYTRLRNMEYYAEKFIGKVRKSFIGKKIFISKALKEYKDGLNPKSSKIKEKERE